MRTELKEVFDRDGETESLSLKDVPPEVLVKAATDLIFCWASLNDLLTWLCGLNSNDEPVSTYVVPAPPAAKSGRTKTPPTANNVFPAEGTQPAPKTCGLASQAMGLENSFLKICLCR